MIIAWSETDDMIREIDSGVATREELIEACAGLRKMYGELEKVLDRRGASLTDAGLAYHLDGELFIIDCEKAVAAHRRMLIEAADKVSADDTPVEVLPLSTRGRNGLLDLGVKTVGQAATMTDREFLRVPNCGEATLKEIKLAIAAYRASRTDARLPASFGELK